MNIQSGHLSSGDQTLSKCSSPANPVLTSLFLQDVRMDGPPDSSVESDHEKQRTDKLVCPRCERAFPYTEKSRWEQHCKRCTDD